MQSSSTQPARMASVAYSSGTVTPTTRPTTPNLTTPPTSTAVETKTDDTSRLKLFISILRKYVVPQSAMVGGGDLRKLAIRTVKSMEADISYSDLLG